MRFIRVKLAVAPMSQLVGFTGFAYLSIGSGTIAEVVEYEEDRCRVIYLGGTDATVQASAQKFLADVGATVVI
ncbi:MAG TPA: hypothetical protein VIY27_10175 [Myxococcota bacterium]